MVRCSLPCCWATALLGAGLGGSGLGSRGWAPRSIGTTFLKQCWRQGLGKRRRGSCRLWRNRAWTGRLGLGNWGLRVCTQGWRWGLGLGSHCGSGWFEPHLRSDEIGGLLCRLAIGATVPAVWFVGVVVRREVAVVAKPGDWYDFSTSNFQGRWLAPFCDDALSNYTQRLGRVLDLRSKHPCCVANRAVAKALTEKLL